MTRPFFSIMLPAKGRPQLVCDALTSLLRQDFPDFEVLFSNNGTDPSVRSAVTHLLADPRVRYVEQAEVLNMPTHWESVSKLATGRYFLVLPDRSVLKQGALRTVKQTHETFGDEADIVTWPWDLYYDQHRLFVGYAGENATATVLESQMLLRNAFGGAHAYPYALPRGLNSSISLGLLDEIRTVPGTVFDKINPDFTCAYQCLILRSKCIYFDQSLMISQGLNVSNGGNAVRGDARPYFATLGNEPIFNHAPTKAALCENGIFEDLLRICHAYGRTDLIDHWDRTTYYLKCLAEIDEKRMAKILDAAFVDSLEAEVQASLAREPQGLQEKVLATRQSSASIGSTLRKAARRAVGPAIVETLRPLALRMRGATQTSVLAAAGFEAQS